MLLTAIIIYLALTVAIGTWASKFVKGSNDFVLAGRSLPLFLSASAVFATWFGSMVLGMLTCLICGRVEFAVDSHIFGLLASIFAMILGSLLFPDQTPKTHGLS